MGCGLGWLVGPKFVLCDGLGWVGSVVWWVGLGRVEEVGPTNNSGTETSRAVAARAFRRGGVNCLLAAP